MPHRLTARAAGVAFALCLAQAADEARILRPADRAVVPAGPLTVIARAPGQPQVLLDGKPVDTAQPAAGVITATLKPTPGAHKLTLVSATCETTAEFFVAAGSAGANKPPPGWKPYRAHPPAATCETCHAVKSGAWGFQQAVLGRSCFQCHNAKTFASAHSHNDQVLAECQLCHDPHGSTEKFHLKMTREVACKQCHG